MKKTCPVCQTPHDRPRATYCSNACRQKAHRKRRPSPWAFRPYLLSCRVCGHEFLAQRADAVYCSSTCRAYAGHQRKGRRLDAPPPEPQDWRSDWQADWLQQVKKSGEFIDRRSGFGLVDFTGT